MNNKYSIILIKSLFYYFLTIKQFNIYSGYSPNNQENRLSTNLLKNNLPSSLHQDTNLLSLNSLNNSSYPSIEIKIPKFNPFDKKDERNISFHLENSLLKHFRLEQSPTCQKDTKKKEKLLPLYSNRLLSRLNLIFRNSTFLHYKQKIPYHWPPINHNNSYLAEDKRIPHSNYHLLLEHTPTTTTTDNNNFKLLNEQSSFSQYPAGQTKQIDDLKRAITETEQTHRKEIEALNAQIAEQIERESEKQREQFEIEREQLKREIEKQAEQLERESEKQREQLERESEKQAEQLERESEKQREIQALKAQIEQHKREKIEALKAQIAEKEEYERAQANTKRELGELHKKKREEIESLQKKNLEQSREIELLSQKIEDLNTQIAEQLEKESKKQREIEALKAQIAEKEDRINFLTSKSKILAIENSESKDNALQKMKDNLNRQENLGWKKYIPFTEAFKESQEIDTQLAANRNNLAKESENIPGLRVVTAEDSFLRKCQKIWETYPNTDKIIIVFLLAIANAGIIYISVSKEKFETIYNFIKENISIFDLIKYSGLAGIIGFGSKKASNLMNIAFENPCWRCKKPTNRNVKCCNKCSKDGEIPENQIESEITE